MKNLKTAWVSMADARKPQQNQQVIVWHKYWGSEMAKYSNGHFMDASGKDNKTIVNLEDVITAWRPLPTNVPAAFKKLNIPVRTAE